MFKKQQKDFAASAAAAARHYAKKPAMASVAVPSTSRLSEKTRTPEPSGPAAMPKYNTVFSQPVDTGKGENIQTQVWYTVEYLRSKIGQEPLKLENILSYLSKSSAEQHFKDAIAIILRRHPQVDYNSKNETYKFRPKHNVSNADELLAHLQKLTTFKGLDVKELKEGWKNVDATIDELEAKHQINVVRNKKDGAPRFVYADDPSLYMAVEPEFKDMWSKIKIPEDHQLVIDELAQGGQVAAGKTSKKASKVGNKVEKPKRKQRRGGKTTNKHMQHIFQDFSAMRR